MSPVVAQKRLDLERDGCKHLRLRCAGALHLQWNLHANPEATKEDIRIIPVLVKNTEETIGKVHLPRRTDEALVRDYTRAFAAGPQGRTPL